MTQHAVVRDVGVAVDELRRILRTHATLRLTRLQELVDYCLSTVPFPILRMVPQIALFRVREGDRETLLSSVSEIAINPDRTAIRPGRCNARGEAVFYCADEERTACYEAISSRRQVKWLNHVAFISRWITSREMRIASFVADPRGVAAFPRTRKLHCQHMQVLASLHPEWMEVSRRLQYIISKAFVDPVALDDDYLFTNVVSQFLLRRYDGIAYQSSIVKGHGINLALRPSLTTDGSLLFVCVARVFYIPVCRENYIPMSNLLAYADERGCLQWRANGGLFSAAGMLDQ